MLPTLDDLRARNTARDLVFAIFFAAVLIALAIAAESIH